MGKVRSRPGVPMLALVLLLAGGARAWGAWGLEASPAVLSLEGMPGGQAQAVVEVRTSAGEPCRLRVHAADWDREEKDGRTRFLAPGALPRSCASWLTGMQGALVLSPGRPERVPVRLRVPEGARGLYWAVLFLEAEPRPAGQERGGVRVTERIGVKIYVLVGPDGEPAWEMVLPEEVPCERTGPGGAVVPVRLRNRGTSEMACEVHAEAFALQAGLEVEGPAEWCRVLPGGERNLALRLPEGAGPGRWQVEAVARCGNQTRTLRRACSMEPGGAP